MQTLNIYAWDTNYEEIEKQVKMLDEVHVDAIIASDGGVIQKIREIAPNIEIHVSTQANVVSYHAAKFWYDNGAKKSNSRQRNKQRPNSRDNEE